MRQTTSITIITQLGRKWRQEAVVVISNAAPPAAVFWQLKPRNAATAAAAEPESVAGPSDTVAVGCVAAGVDAGVAVAISTSGERVLPAVPAMPMPMPMPKPMPKPKTGGVCVRLGAAIRRFEIGGVCVCPRRPDGGGINVCFDEPMQLLKHRKQRCRRPGLGWFRGSSGAIECGMQCNGAWHGMAWHGIAI